MSNDDNVSTWRIVLAVILDFFTAFFVFGFIVAYFTGGLTEDGFQLNGLSAFISFVLIALYFWVFPKYFGGSTWQRILKAVR